MDIEFESEQRDPDDDDNDDEVNDCTGVLRLQNRNTKVYSSMFTSQTLAALDIEDQAMLGLIIGFCSSNFAQQHEEVRAYLKKHKTTHCEQIFVVYVVCVIVPVYKRYRYSKLKELKELRATRIIDIEVGPKLSDVTAATSNNNNNNGAPLLIQQQRGQINITVHSMLNPLELVDLSYTRINYNTVRAANHEAPSDRGVIKRKRRKYEEDGK